MDESAGRQVAPYDPERAGRHRARVERGFWDKVRRTLGRVPFLDEAVSAYFCARDSETPLQVKAVLLGALAYFVIPADMIPDFITGLGFSDDATVLFAAIQTVSPHIKERHRAEARGALARLRGEPAASA